MSKIFRLAFTPLKQIMVTAAPPLRIGSLWVFAPPKTIEDVTIFAAQINATPISKIRNLFNSKHVPKSVCRVLRFKISENHTAQNSNSPLTNLRDISLFGFSKKSAGLATSTILPL